MSEKLDHSDVLITIDLQQHHPLTPRAIVKSVDVVLRSRRERKEWINNKENYQRFKVPYYELRYHLKLT
jgi:hypothetical protein